MQRIFGLTICLTLTLSSLRSFLIVVAASLSLRLRSKARGGLLISMGRLLTSVRVALVCVGVSSLIAVGVILTVALLATLLLVLRSLLALFDSNALRVDDCESRQPSTISDGSEGLDLRSSCCESKF